MCKNNFGPPSVSLEPVFFTRKLYCLKSRTGLLHLQIQVHSMYYGAWIGTITIIQPIRNQSQNPIRFHILLLKSPHFYNEMRPSQAVSQVFIFPDEMPIHSENILQMVPSGTIIWLGDNESSIILSS